MLSFRIPVARGTPHTHRAGKRPLAAVLLDVLVAVAAVVTLLDGSTVEAMQGVVSRQREHDEHSAAGLDFGLGGVAFLLT